MVKIGVHAARDRQFRTLKKISKKLAKSTGIDLADVESFVLKQEFFRGLLYESHIDLFIFDFSQWMEAKMDATGGLSRQQSLNRRIWRKI